MCYHQELLHFDLETHVLKVYRSSLGFARRHRLSYEAPASFLCVETTVVNGNYFTAISLAAGWPLTISDREEKTPTELSVQGLRNAKKHAT